MPGQDSPWGDALVAAVRDGAVEPTVIDDKVLRILRLAERVGALTDEDGHAATPTYTTIEVASQVRSAAAAGSVLVRNDGVLPHREPSMSCPC